MNDPNLWAMMHSVTEQIDYHKDRTFEDTWQTFWSPFEDKCRSIAQNQYVMHRAVQYFKDEYLDKQRPFETVPLWAYIVRECESVGMDADEYLHWGWAHFVRRCNLMATPKHLNSL